MTELLARRTPPKKLGTADAPFPVERAAAAVAEHSESTMLGFRAWMAGGVLFALSVATPGLTAPTEHVITFDGVVVRGFIGIYDRPEIAHLEVPAVAKPITRSAEQDSYGARPPAEPPTLAPLSPLALAPGQGTNNPSFEQEGFLVEAFWAVKLGSASAYFRRGHFHPPNLATGFEAQHLGNPNELHGIYIRSLDGRPFGLKSLRYRVTRNRELPTKPGSIEGFSNYDVNVLIARSFDPRRAIRGQFVVFPVGLPAGNDPTLPWWTLPMFGFEAVEQVFIASSASVDFDDIGLTRTER
jgi:hypothetical protein